MEGFFMVHVDMLVLQSAETMEEDLTRMWENFSSLKEEDNEIKFAPQTLEEPVQYRKTCIVGKLIAERPISKEIIRLKLTRG
jgi:hypothetical protein